MPLVPSATLLVAVLAELDVTLSKPPPAQAETRPDATVAPKLNHLLLKWFTEFGHLNRGDMLTSEQHRCHNEKKKFQRRV